MKTRLRVLVTGASGMVGRSIVSYLTRNGVQTISTDVTGQEIAGSITEKSFVFGRLASLDFDAIIHLAAMTDIRSTIENPQLCYEVNCFGTLNMLELAVRKDVDRFIYSSSANVYGGPKHLPLTEDSALEPRVPYDYSKVIGEQMAMSYFKNRGLATTITRSWLLFGENDQPNRAIIRFVRACLLDEPLTLYNGGKDTTAPSHAMNYARLVLEILRTRRAEGEIFNFGGEKVVSVRELARLIKKLTGSESRLIMAPPRSEAETEPQISYPSIRKIKKVLGYKHELTLEQGLLRTADWARSTGLGGKD